MSVPMNPYESVFECIGCVDIAVFFSHDLELLIDVQLIS